MEIFSIRIIAAENTSTKNTSTKNISAERNHHPTYPCRVDVGCRMNLSYVGFVCRMILSTRLKILYLLLSPLCNFNPVKLRRYEDGLDLLCNPPSHLCCGKLPLANSLK